MTPEEAQAALNKSRVKFTPEEVKLRSHAVTCADSRAARAVARMYPEQREAIFRVALAEELRKRGFDA